MKDPQPATMHHAKPATISGVPRAAGPQGSAPARRRYLTEDQIAEGRRALANRFETGWSTVEEASKNSELYRWMRDHLPALLDMAQEDLHLRAVACQCEYGFSEHCPVHGVPALAPEPASI